MGTSALTQRPRSHSPTLINNTRHHAGWHADVTCVSAGNGRAARRWCWCRRGHRWPGHRPGCRRWRGAGRYSRKAQQTGHAPQHRAPWRCQAARPRPALYWRVRTERRQAGRCWPRSSDRRQVKRRPKSPACRARSSTALRLRADWAPRERSLRARRAGGLGPAW